MNKYQIENMRAKLYARDATGNENAGDYADWARDNGYSHCAVYDWTSSAGDWTFIVSKTGRVWFVMNQENNYPRRGFTRTIDKSRRFYGTAAQVLQRLADESAAQMELAREYNEWVFSQTE